MGSGGAREACHRVPRDGDGVGDDDAAPVRDKATVGHATARSSYTRRHRSLLTVAVATSRVWLKYAPRNGFGVTASVTIASLNSIVSDA